MNNTVTIDTANLSTAWAKAFLALMKPGCMEITPLIVSVTGINCERIEGTDDIRRELDETLSCYRKASSHTIANTIFPKLLWNQSRERTLLYKRYMEHAWPRLKHCPANHRGTYFQRLVAYENGKNPINQLEHVIETWQRGNHRHSALQLSVFDPRHDHTDSRRLGFPCLHQVCFTPLGANGCDGLAVTGFYATQYVFEKAYGNYLGLCRLGQFVAHELRLRLVRMTCVAALAKLGVGETVNKSDLEPLAGRVRALLMPEEVESACEPLAVAASS